MAAVYFRLHRPKDETGNDKTTPVSIRVQLYINKNTKPEIATGEKILPKHWTGHQAKSTMRGAAEFNAHLRKIHDDLMQLWRDNKEDLSKINEALMRTVVIGSDRRTEKKTLFLTLDKFLEDYSLNKEEKTLDRYRALKTRLTEFSKGYPVEFETLEHNFYDAFKRFLYGVPNPNYTGFSLHRSTDDNCYLVRRGDDGLSIGLFDDTVYKYFVNLKTFLSWAEKRGHKVNPSYKTWEIIKKKHPPISLTQSELEKLESVELESEALRIARDYLVFECRTGQRISDIKAFNQKDYDDYKWTLRPKKGNRLSSKTVTVHFKGYCAPALFILAKYNFKMPTVSEQKLNKNIKLVCQKAGINAETYTERWAGNKKVILTGKKWEFVSSHTGRKTFITLALQNGMPIEYVMELTGITEYSTIKHYRAKFEDSEIEKYLQSLGDNLTVLKKAQ